LVEKKKRRKPWSRTQNSERERDWKSYNTMTNQYKTTVREKGECPTKRGGGGVAVSLLKKG